MVSRKVYLFFSFSLGLLLPGFFHAMVPVAAVLNSNGRRMQIKPPYSWWYPWQATDKYMEEIHNENLEKIVMHAEVDEKDNPERSNPGNISTKIYKYYGIKPFLAKKKEMETKKSINSNSSQSDQSDASLWQRTYSFFFPTLLGEFGSMIKDTNGDHVKINAAISDAAKAKGTILKNKTLGEDQEYLLPYRFDEYQFGKKRVKRLYPDHKNRHIAGHIEYHNDFKKAIEDNKFKNSTEALNSYHTGLKEEKEKMANTILDRREIEDVLSGYDKNKVRKAYLDVRDDGHEAARDLIYQLDAFYRRKTVHKEQIEHIQKLNVLQNKQIKEPNPCDRLDLQLSALESYPNSHLKKQKL